MGTKRRKFEGYRPPPLPQHLLDLVAARNVVDVVPFEGWYRGPAVRDAPEDELDVVELRQLARALKESLRNMRILSQAEAAHVRARAIAAEQELEQVADARGRGGHARWSKDQQRKIALAIVDRHVSDGTWETLTHQDISDEIHAALGIEEERGSMFGADWVGDRLRERGCRKRPVGGGAHQKH